MDGNGDNQADIQLRATSTHLSLVEQNSSLDISIGQDWALNQWVFTYLYSEAASSEHGLGAFVRGVGTEYFEAQAAPAYNMEQHPSGEFRIGSSPSDDQPLSNLRKMLIFKGVAYTQASNQIVDVLAGERATRLRCLLS